jgi:hypothetical protein
MGKARRFEKKKPRIRPKKSGGVRRRREKVQKNRLIALGMPEEKAKKLNQRQVKDLLKVPKVTARRIAKAKDKAAEKANAPA